MEAQGAQQVGDILLPFSLHKLLSMQLKTVTTISTCLSQLNPLFAPFNSILLLTKT